eukprot:Platyproteum_vivax@DN10104_c0_g1_i1.p1
MPAIPQNSPINTYLIQEQAATRLMQQRRRINQITKQFQEVVRCSELEDADAKELAVALKLVDKTQKELVQHYNKIAKASTDRKEWFIKMHKELEYLCGHSIDQLDDLEREELFTTISRATHHANVTRQGGPVRHKKTGNSPSRDKLPPIPPYQKFTMPKEIQSHTTVGYAAHVYEQLQKQIAELGETQRQHGEGIDLLLHEYDAIEKAYGDLLNECDVLFELWGTKQRHFKVLASQCARLQGAEEALVGLEPQELENLSLQLSRYMQNVTVEISVRNARR